MSSVKGPAVRKRNRRSDLRIKSQEDLFLSFMEGMGYSARGIRETFQPVFEDNTFLHMYMALLAQVAARYLTGGGIDDNTIRDTYIRMKIDTPSKADLYQGFYYTYQSYYNYLRMMLPNNMIRM